MIIQAHYNDFIQKIFMELHESGDQLVVTQHKYPKQHHISIQGKKDFLTDKIRKPKTLESHLGIYFQYIHQGLILQGHL
jgi:hypothetical protein